ncbi:MAG: acyltransferase family protein [Actinobacteria bacterium]|nr:acyltransferase family protein [Actinomycetota bacterium]
MADTADPVLTEAPVGPTAPQREVTREGGGGSHPAGETATPTKRASRRFAVGLAAIAAAGFAWRAFYIVAVKFYKWNGTDACDGADLCGDAIYYNLQARLNATGRLFQDPLSTTSMPMPAADHPPMAALVLTPISWITSNLLVQRFVMALIGTASIVVIGMLGRRVARGGDGRLAAQADAIGWIAAAVAAVNANLWMNDGLLMSESVATLGIAVSLLLVYRFHDEPSVPNAAWLGFAVGMTILSRAEMALFVPLVVLPVALLSKRLRWAQRVGRFGIAAGLVVLVLAPWSAWNATRFEKPVLISTNDGITLIGANCPPTYYEGGVGFWVLSCRDDAYNQLDPSLDQSQVSAELRTQAFDFIRNNKRQLPYVAEIRVRRIWNLYYPHQMVFLNKGEGREAWASWTGILAADALLVLSVFGSVWLWKRRISVWPLVATAVIASLTAMVFYGIARFRLPADIAMSVLGAVAIDELARRTIAWWRARPERVAERDRRRGRASTDNELMGREEKSAGEHFPALDAYRGLAMTLVLLNHASYSTGFINRGLQPDASLNEKFFGPLMARTDLGVTAFFVLSGFLLFRPFARNMLAGRPVPDRHALKSFYLRRVLRIFPAYWAALFGIAVIFGLRIRGIGNWIANLFFLPAFGYPAEVCEGGSCRTAYAITQAWSIGIEVTFYVVLPIIAIAIHHLAKRREGGARVAVMLASVGALYLVTVVFRLVVVFARPGWARQSLLWLPMYLDIFAVGMALAVISTAIKAGYRMPRLGDWLTAHPNLCWAITGAIFVFMAMLPLAKEPFGLNGNEYLARQFLYGLGSSIWLWPAMFGDQTKGRLRAFLSSRPMVYLGAISLSFYLWHLNILEAVKDWTIPGYAVLQQRAADAGPNGGLASVATFTGNFVVVAVLTWLLSFAVGSVLYRSVEVPFLRLKGKPIRSLFVRPPLDGPDRLDRPDPAPRDLAEASSS